MKNSLLFLLYLHHFSGKYFNNSSTSPYAFFLVLFLLVFYLYSLYYILCTLFFQIHCKNTHFLSNYNFNVANIIFLIFQTLSLVIAILYHPNNSHLIPLLIIEIFVFYILYTIL